MDDASHRLVAAGFVSLPVRTPFLHPVRGHPTQQSIASSHSDSWTRRHPTTVSRHPPPSFLDVRCTDLPILQSFCSCRFFHSHAASNPVFHRRRRSADSCNMKRIDLNHVNSFHACSVSIRSLSCSPPPHPHRVFLTSSAPSAADWDSTTLAPASVQVPRRVRTVLMSALVILRTDEIARYPPNARAAAPPSPNTLARNASLAQIGNLAITRKYCIRCLRQSSVQSSTPNYLTNSAHTRDINSDEVFDSLRPNYNINSGFFIQTGNDYRRIFSRICGSAAICAAAQLQLEILTFNLEGNSVASTQARPSMTWYFLFFGN
ncbi:hypothetical protein C8R44DRAFT_68544 [Mycena epipterygia]|nr:hypothetical protein C8R44DRAFT_68544 [Mycena epipterygia]